MKKLKNHIMWKTADEETENYKQKIWKAKMKRLKNHKITGNEETEKPKMKKLKINNDEVTSSFVFFNFFRFNFWFFSVFICEFFVKKLGFVIVLCSVTSKRHHFVVSQIQTYKISDLLRWFYCSNVSISNRRFMDSFRSQTNHHM